VGGQGERLAAMETGQIVGGERKNGWEKGELC